MEYYMTFYCEGETVYYGYMSYIPRQGEYIKLMGQRGNIGIKDYAIDKVIHRPDIRNKTDGTQFINIYLNRIYDYEED